MNLRTKLLCGFAAILAAGLAAQAQVPGVNSTLNTVFTLAYDNSTMKQTFSSTQRFVPAAAATDICTLVGSATKQIRLRRILFNMLASAIQSDPVAIVKRSTANSGGTSASNNGNVPYDSSNAAATAVFRIYTANPTTGTAVGLLADPYVTTGNLTTGGPPAGITEFKFGELGQAIVLRGVAQSVSVNLNALTYLTPEASCTFEWTEE